MTEITRTHEEMHWDLFRKAEKIAQSGGGPDALDILYFLEIQDLPLPLRIHVNTTLSTVDTAPGCWQKMEWISEARVVLRWHRDSLENDKDGLNSCLALEEKIRAAELGLRKQMGIPEYDDYDDDDGSGDEDCDEQDEDEMKNEDEYEAESEDQDNVDDGEDGDADDQAISALK